MGCGAEGCCEAPVRGRDRGDEPRRLHQYPGAQEAPGRVDDAGRADNLAGCALWRSTVTFTPGPIPNTVRAADGTVKPAPDGWALLPPRDAALTRRVKAAGEHWIVQERKGRKVFSRGVWAPASTIERIRAELEAERSTPAGEGPSRVRRGLLRGSGGVPGLSSDALVSVHRPMEAFAYCPHVAHEGGGPYRFGVHQQQTSLGRRSTVSARISLTEFPISFQLFEWPTSRKGGKPTLRS
jgi:hypothetical protein